MEAFRDGRYEKALEDFQKAIIIFPDDPDIPFYIGLTYLQLNEPDRATESFKKAIEKDPEYLDAHFQLGVILIQKKAYQGAVTHLEKVYKKEPDREDLGYFIGFANYQMGQYEKALNYFEKAKTKDKTIESLTLYYTGLVRQQLGQTKEAVAAYKQLIITDPTSPLAAPSQRLIEIIEIEEWLKKRFHIELIAKL
jgi:tetratricopeptide (TPR) repeat protein